LLDQIFIYPLGVPILVLTVLRKNRKKLDDPALKMQLGFLYEGLPRELACSI
jgi:hypothetical protein